MSRLFFLLLKFSFRSERFRPSYLILYSKRAGKPFWVLSRSFFLLSDVSLERFCYRVAFTVPETCSVFLFFYSCFLWHALLPMEVMPVAFFILTVFSLLQPANAFFSIFFTLLPIVTFFSFLQLLNAFLLIRVTL